MHSKRTSFALIAALLLGGVGCAASNPGIEIQGLLVPNDMCMYMPQANQTFMIAPILDTSIPTTVMRVGGIRYTGVFQLVNRMLNQANSVYPIMTDTNSFHVDEAEVELRDVAGNPLTDLAGLSPRFRVPASGFVPSATGGTALGYGIATADVIPAVYGDALFGRSGTIIAAVRFSGVTSGDSRQITGEYDLVLELCAGCLFQCAYQEDGVTPIPAPITGCWAGQDSVSLLSCPMGVP